MHSTKADAPRLGESTRWTLAFFFYISSVLGSSVAAFGVIGLLPGLVLPPVWFFVLLSNNPPRALLKVVAVTVSVLVLVALLFPGVQIGRGARSPCWTNLRHLGLAVQNYHDDHGSFPPVYTTDDDGNRLLSWRVLILPYIGEQELYEEFDLTQRWDGPHNQTLLSRIPDVFKCPSSEGHRAGDDTRTSYVAVVGDETAWPGASTRAYRDLKDGPTLTLLVIEYGAGRIPWTEPRDLEFNEALEVLAAADPDWASGHQSNDFFVAHCYGRRYVTFADGRVQYASWNRQTWRELLTVNDGAPRRDYSEVFQEATHKSRLRTANCLRTALFGFLSLLPLPWVRLNPTSQVSTPR